MVSVKQDLFQVPCTIAHVPEWQDVKKDFLSIINWDDPRCVDESFYSDFHTYFCQGEVPPYHNDLMEILKEPIQFVVDSAPQPVEIPSSWCQKYGKHQMHPVHTHSVHGYSAVFYAQLAEDHKPTNFFSPFVDPWNGFPDEITPELMEGDIIFFPSQILHQSLPHKSEQDRIIFSFNLL